MIINTQPITGASLPATAFRLHETERVVDIDAVFDVLHGELAAYRIRGFVPQNVCDRIVQNFWDSEQRVPRYGEGRVASATSEQVEIVFPDGRKRQFLSAYVERA